MTTPELAQGAVGRWKRLPLKPESPQRRTALSYVAIQHLEMESAMFTHPFQKRLTENRRVQRPSIAGRRLRLLCLETLEQRACPASLVMPVESTFAAVPVTSPDFTISSPTSGGQLPTGVTRVGGVVLDMIGTNGVRVVSQVPASTLFVGFFSDGSPTAFRGNPGTIGIQTGFTSTIIGALGGGLSEVAVRITLQDGDTGPGDFDDEDDNFLLLNGISIGDFSDVPTQRTNSTGTVVLSGNPGGGFRDNLLDTGFFYTNDPTALANIFNSLVSSGQIRYQLQDVDAYDNFFDFTQGVDGGLINVGQAPNVRPIANDDSAKTTIGTPTIINVLSNDTDPDGTLNVASITIGTGPANGSVSIDAVTGAVTFTPKPGFTGKDSFTYTVADNLGSISNVATVNIDVQQPTAVADVLVHFGSLSYSIFNNNRILPWTTITAIDIVFNQDVTVDQNDISLAGLNIAAYVGTFSYDPATHRATWQLATPIGADRLTLRLDGDDATADGNDGIRTANGTAWQGGDYNLDFKVLPGDYNGDGVVTIQDSVGVRDHMPNYGTYDIFADLDGDQDVDLDDMNAPRRRLGWKLP